MSGAGNLNALEHGGYSERRVAARAKAHRRRIRRGLGVRAADLDPVTTEWLRHYSEGAARCDLLPPDSGDAWTAFNSTTRALRRLEDRLRELGLLRTGEPEARLGDYLRTKYGKGEGANGG